jgi:hypothetical protein
MGILVCPVLKMRRMREIKGIRKTSEDKGD